MTAVQVMHAHCMQQAFIVDSAMQVPAYAVYMLWGMVRPYLSSIIGSGPKVITSKLALQPFNLDSLCWLHLYWHHMPFQFYAGQYALRDIMLNRI